MKKHLWTRWSLNFLIGAIPPRVLYYPNKLIAKLQWPVVTPTQDRLERAILPPTPAIPISKPAFLDNGYLRSPAGLTAFKKLSTSPVLPEYLECQLEGLQFFDRVFRGADGHHLSYNDIMTEHHRILATGLNGERNYLIGGSSQEYSKDVAGARRAADGGRTAIAVTDKKMVQAILWALTEIEFYPDRPWEIQIDAIPTHARSRGNRNRKGFNVAYPEGRDIPLYFFRMEEMLSLIRHLSAENETAKNADRSRLLQALATYFHLGIHAHAFVRINQSLLMAQVNYILMLNRFRPVYHGYVDLVAAFLGTGHFGDYFRRHVAGVQSA